MSFFGEYLVNKKLIDEKGLLNALLDQVKNQPSVFQVVFENKWLSDSDILKIINIQSKEKIGFIEAGKKVSLWSSDLESKVESKIQEKKIPLGQILIQKGILDMEKMTKALDDFLSQVENEPQIKQEPKTESATHENKADSSVSAYLDGFTLDDQKNVGQIFSSLGTSSSSVLINLAELAHRWVGMARFCSLKKSESVLVEFESLLREMSNKKDLSKIDPNILTQLSETGKECLLYLGLFRDAIEKGEAEESILTDPEVLAKYDRLISGMQILKFDLEMA